MCCNPVMRLLIQFNLLINTKSDGIFHRFFVIHTGFEPVTSSLSRRRSKPTELMNPDYVVIRMRLERMTVCLEGRCSIQLSYRTYLGLLFCKGTLLIGIVQIFFDCKRYFKLLMPVLFYCGRKRAWSGRPSGWRDR